MQKMIEKYSPMVYRLAYALVKSRADADDIHQEVFLKYMKYNPRFEGEEHEKAWFIRVTTNQCRNWWKSAWKKRVVSLSEYKEEYVEQNLFEEKDKELIEIVRLLPQKYRIVIHLFYYEELSIEEMADILGRKPSTVRTQLTRARKLLGELLKEEI